MNLIFMGPPGAGKGTQSKRLAAELRIPHISIGDMLREAARENTELGRQAKPLIDAGLFVPDKVVIGIVDSRLRLPDVGEGFILDGFPRTVPQAEALDVMLSEEGKNIDQVFSLDVPEDMIIDRITGRRSCPKDSMVYHLTANPPQIQGVCDQCGEKLIQRDDDRPDRILERIKLYRSRTSPLIDYYQGRNALISISGAGGQEGVWAEILSKVRLAGPQEVFKKN